jgi:DNA replication protein DnaD
MARAMFEYTKTILEKVSFNKELFKKELEKAMNRLLPYELKELYYWLKEFTINKPELYPCLAIVKMK